METIRKQMGKSWELQFGDSGKAFCSRSQLIESSCAAENIWIPVDISTELIYQLFYSDRIKSSEYVEELSRNVNEVTVDVETSLLWQDESEGTTQSVDLFMFLQMVMKTYRSHRKKQNTLIRLMFDTASKGVLTDFYNAPESINTQCNQEGMISLPQLFQIVQTLWPSTTLQETAQIYRDAYDVLYPPSQWNRPAPGGIDFKGFLVAAERHHLFSRMPAVSVSQSK